jgi:hypothetical protein
VSIARERLTRSDGHSGNPVREERRRAHRLPGRRRWAVRPRRNRGPRRADDRRLRLADRNLRWPQIDRARGCVRQARHRSVGPCRRCAVSRGKNGRRARRPRRGRIALRGAVRSRRRRCDERPVRRDLPRAHFRAGAIPGEAEVCASTRLSVGSDARRVRARDAGGESEAGHHRAGARAREGGFREPTRSGCASRRDGGVSPRVPGHISRSAA